VVANGDSLVKADLRPVREALRDPGLDGVLLGVRVADACRFGSLRVGADQRLQGFLEKQPGNGIINAGVYFLEPRALASFPAKAPLSVEKDVFPQLLASGFKLLVHTTESPFLDIGTPESLSQAETFLQAHFLR
jgi:D-glycero-alpha-D-manno-heptose 1-phosphate guanylyltransferase